LFDGKSFPGHLIPLSQRPQMPKLLTQELEPVKGGRSYFDQHGAIKFVEKLYEGQITEQADIDAFEGAWLDDTAEVEEDIAELQRIAKAENVNLKLQTIMQFQHIIDNKDEIRTWISELFERLREGDDDDSIRGEARTILEEIEALNKAISSLDEKLNENAR